MQQRKDEILAKKAKLAELKRQRELRQKEFTATRQSIGDASELAAPVPNRADNRKDLDSLISSLVGEGRPSSPRDSVGAYTPGGRSRPTSVLSAAELAAAGGSGARSRPTSVLSGGELSAENGEVSSPTAHTLSSPAFIPQTLSTAPLATVYEFAPSPEPEFNSISIGVQTSEEWGLRGQQEEDGFVRSDDEGSPTAVKTPKRLSRRERDREEEIRQNIRREIEDELKSLKGSQPTGQVAAQASTAQQNFPSRALTDEELNAVTSSDDFMVFIDRSTKVIERALDEEYDVLADYALGGMNGLDDEDEEYSRTNTRKGRRIREVAQFWDERWSKKRMISSVGFSPKFPELVLASYTKNPSAPHDPDGLVQVWNLHLHDRPEYIFHAQSDVLVSKFSPFHPNLIIGGAYSGQVLLWDTRAKASPIQKTPLTGNGHAHPVYALDIVGTQNAHNILTCSTDGVVCSWSIDMLTQPQEFLELTTPPIGTGIKTDDLAPTCMAFPQADPTFFLVGTEEGSIYSCHRYDRAGAKAGVEQRIAYKGHAAPVMSMSFHPPRGPIDLSDLVLSSSVDWSVKLWRVRPPASVPSTASTAPQIASPILEIAREDLVYDAAWSPCRPGVFSLVDGAGNLEVWDITVDTEVPVARISPSMKGGRNILTKSLNKCAWEPHDGRRIATGGLDGVVSVFEVGTDLGGIDNARTDEWTAVKKLVSRLDFFTPSTGMNGA